MVPQAVIYLPELELKLFEPRAILRVLRGPLWQQMIPKNKKIYIMIFIHNKTKYRKK